MTENSPTSEASPAPQKLATKVGPGEATAGTLIAGLIGAITGYASRKLHLPVEAVSGVFGLVASGAMAIWHQVKG